MHFGVVQGTYTWTWWEASGEWGLCWWRWRLYWWRWRRHWWRWRHGCRHHDTPTKERRCFRITCWVFRTWPVVCVHWDYCYMRHVVGRSLTAMLIGVEVVAGEDVMWNRKYMSRNVFFLDGKGTLCVTSCSNGISVLLPIDNFDLDLLLSAVPVCFHNRSLIRNIPHQQACLWN